MLERVTPRSQGLSMDHVAPAQTTGGAASGPGATAEAAGAVALRPSGNASPDSKTQALRKAAAAILAQTGAVPPEELVDLLDKLEADEALAAEYADDKAEKKRGRPRKYADLDDEERRKRRMIDNRQSAKRSYYRKVERRKGLEDENVMLKQALALELRRLGDLDPDIQETMAKAAERSGQGRINPQIVAKFAAPEHLSMPLFRHASSFAGKVPAGEVAISVDGSPTPSASTATAVATAATAATTCDTTAKSE
eukprot:COSAG05_NODE_4579_length_1453_cov_1.580502_1_plen_253_part_00